MKDKNILIVGANGQMGKALQRQYPHAGAVDAAELDITKPEAVDAFGWSGITVVVNSAAYTNVDGAETSEGRVSAWQVNAGGVTNLARLAIKNDVLLMHISSDYVFDGQQSAHKETEPLSPISVYGASKAAGDIAVALVPKHYIFRTSWLIGDGKNFVRTMLDLATRGVEPGVVSDQVGRPTFTAELVKVIDFFLKNHPPYGTYNVSNSGTVVSWADFARTIFKSANLKVEVTDINSAKYYADKKDTAPRPANSAFDLSKLQSTGFSSTDWKEDLSRYIKGEDR